jgi:hypothetical protein
MDRLKDNLKLLKIIEIYIKNNPDVRFIQALWALGIIDKEIINGPDHKIYVPVDRFYEEPDVTLKRIKECYKVTLEKIKNLYKVDKSNKGL